MMDEVDMDNSMMSVTSISSEVAAALTGSGKSDDTSASLTSEAIRDIVVPAGQAVEDFEHPSLSTGMFQLSISSVSQNLEQVCPPTILEDITNSAQDTVTLKPNRAAETYVVGTEECG